MNKWAFSGALFCASDFEGEVIRVTIPLHSDVNITPSPRTAITRDVAAKLDGVPPVVLLATQLSTKHWGNTVSYRSSGPIPTGLYRNIINGDAAPKPFTQKVKSSNWGVMEGFAVVDDRLARSEFSTEKRFSIRAHGAADLPKENGIVKLNTFALKVSLRDILNDTVAEIPSIPKYELIKDNNPDENGILRFKQAGHPNPHVNNVVFSINLNDAKAEKTPQDQAGLLSSKNDEAKPWDKPGFELEGWRKELGNFADKLDSSFPSYAQFPNDPNPKPVQVYGEELMTVRDVDLDFITRPTTLADRMTPNQAGYDKYFETIDMSHGSPQEKFQASKQMLMSMFKINSSEWNRYDELKAQLVAEKGAAFNEMEIADKMPLVPKFPNLNMISKFAVTVGLGSPMELYQAMEINILNQRLLSLGQKNPQMNMDDFTDPKKMKAALFALNNEPIIIDDKMIQRFFIQHPAECHNHHYTSDRGASVMVNKAGIALPQNDAEVIKYLNSNARGEYVPLNPEWMGDKPGANIHAESWVKFYISNFDPKRDVDTEVNTAVVNYLDNNPAFIEKELKGYVADMKGLGNFLEAHPQIKEIVSKPREIVQDKIAIAQNEEEPQRPRLGH